MAMMICDLNLAPKQRLIDTAETKPLRRPILSLLTAVVVAVTASQSPAVADDFISEVPGAYKVTISQVLLQGLSTLEQLRGQVSVEMQFQNLSDEPMSLDRSQIKAKCADRTFSVTAGSQDPMLPRKPITLQPKETVSGWLRFSVYHSSPTEPELGMKFDIENQTLDVSINDAIKKTTSCTLRKIGPNQMLAVVSIKRPMDGFAVWVLADTFQQLKQSGTERVIVEFLSIKDTWAVSSNSMSVNSVDAWLQSATTAQQSAIRLFSNNVKSPVQFEMLHVVQPSTYRKATYGFASLHKPDLESAIAASLRDAFQVMPAEEMESAFASPEAGIRRAALETNLDRLPDERLQELFDSAADDVEQQKLLAAELHRSASKLALVFLEELARSSNPEVSQAAMLSIIKSASERSVPAALALWREFEGDSDWETDFANAILNQDDYRFTAVLATYAERRLMALATAPLDASEPAKAQKDDKVQPRSGIELLNQRRNASANQSSRRQMNTLPRVFRFLQKQNDPQFEDIAVQHLLNVRDPKTQDDVLNYVLEAKSDQVQQLVHDYIALRLPKTVTPAGSEQLTDQERRRLEQKYSRRGATASTWYSTQLFATIKRYPKAEYTDRLLELSEDTTLPSSSRTSAFEAAFQGATPQQIDTILEDFDDFSRLRRSQTLKSLKQLQHPKWLELAERSLTISQDAAQDTLRLLQQDSSLEAALIMVRFLDDARLEAERKAKIDSPLIEQFNRQIASSAANLYQVNHPEAMKYLNRLEKSPLLYFHNIGRQTKIRRFLSSRNGQLKRRANELRIEGKVKEAEEIYRQVLESDPFDDSAMSSLASLCMRSDRPKEAMQLLLEARKVSPEDVETESFIGLAMIRLGNVDGGLKLTEKTLVEVPDLQTPLRMNALYNTACAYSRASEKMVDQTQKDQHIATAFRYLNLSIDRDEGFKDFQHALDDPDLTALHQNPEWKIAINKMKAKSKAPDPG